VNGDRRSLVTLADELALHCFQREAAITLGCPPHRLSSGSSRKEYLMSILDKAKDIAGKVAEKAEEGVSAAKDASVKVAGKVADVSTDVAKTVADKTIDAARATADAVKRD
jgi:hypothetical protein